MSESGGIEVSSLPAVARDGGGVAAGTDTGESAAAPSGPQVPFTAHLSEQMAGSPRRPDPQGGSSGATRPGEATGHASSSGGNATAVDAPPWVPTPVHTAPVTVHGHDGGSEPLAEPAGGDAPPWVPTPVHTGPVTIHGHDSGSEPLAEPLAELAAEPAGTEDEAVRSAGSAGSAGQVSTEPSGTTPDVPDGTVGDGTQPAGPRSRPGDGTPTVDGSPGTDPNSPTAPGAPEVPGGVGSANHAPTPGAGSSDGGDGWRLHPPTTPVPEATAEAPVTGSRPAPPSLDPSGRSAHLASVSRAQSGSPGSPSAPVGPGAQTGATEPASSPSGVDPASDPLDVESLAGSISRPLTGGSGNYTVVVAMHPPDLGHLRAVMSLDGNDLQVSITAQTQAGHDALSTAVDGLRDQLSRGGINVNITLRDPGSHPGGDDRHPPNDARRALPSSGGPTPTSPAGPVLTAGQIHLVL